MTLNRIAITTLLSMLGVMQLSSTAIAAPTPLLSLPKPWIIPHRGSALLYPENSNEAFESSLADGAKVIESDVFLLSDSSLGIMHDPTLDRTSTGIGNTAASSLLNWKAITLDAQSWLGYGYANSRPPLFEEMATKISPNAVIMPEAKNYGSGVAMTREAKRLGLKSGQMVVQSFFLSELVAPVAAGYGALFLVDKLSSVGVSWSRLASLGVKYIAFAQVEDGNAPRIAAAHAVGLKVLSWTLNSRAQLNANLILGVDGVITDDYKYLMAKAPLAMADTWSTGRWMPGMIASGSRGSLFADGTWGYANTTTGYQGTLQGWASPTKSSFKMDFDVAITATDTSSTWWWVSAFICAASDDKYSDSPKNSVTGYHLLLRANGRMEVYKKDLGVPIYLVASQSGQQLTMEKFVHIVVDVNKDTITFKRTDTNQSLTIYDSAYRGGYFHLGRSGAAAKFKNLTIQ